MRCAVVFAFALVSLSFFTTPAAVRAEEMAFGDGKLVLESAEGWKKKMPKVNIIEHECEIPAAEGDELPGRLTIMGAGGSVEDNVNRWIGQFEQPDGSATKDKSKTQELAVAGQKIHYVDLSGTYKDQAGPFAPAVKRENYRMLGAIIVTEKLGNYFVKFYGPKKTVDAQEESFKKMLNGLKVK